MRIVLAPMEGLAEHIMRAVLTRVAAVDWCVSEFVRVTSSVLPAKAFYRISPELQHAARTEAGIETRVQLLGSDPEMMAANALKAAHLGAPVIDLNFGCPAPQVNRHRGGAILLNEPETLYAITRAVRGALPAEVPLTAKMRLGFDDKTRAIECAQALASGGIAELVVHARTRAEGYRPPAHWTWIARIAEQVHIPVIANGEIWTLADYQRCQAECGIADVMLGRGLIANPGLAGEIRGLPPLAWEVIQPLLLDFYQRVLAHTLPKHAPGRVKLWLRYLAQHYPQAAQLYAVVRSQNDAQSLLQQLQAGMTR